MPDFGHSGQSWRKKEYPLCDLGQVGSALVYEFSGKYLIRPQHGNQVVDIFAGGDTERFYRRSIEFAVRHRPFGQRAFVNWLVENDIEIAVTAVLFYGHA